VRLLKETVKVLEEKAEMVKNELHIERGKNVAVEQPKMKA
jgi:hypothetical protein